MPTYDYRTDVQERVISVGCWRRSFAAFLRTDVTRDVIELSRSMRESYAAELPWHQETPGDGEVGRTSAKTRNAAREAIRRRRDVWQTVPVFLYQTRELAYRCVLCTCPVRSHSMACDVCIKLAWVFEGPIKV